MIYLWFEPNFYDPKKGIYGSLLIPNILSFEMWFWFAYLLETSFQQICSPSGAHDSAKGSWVFLWSKGRLGLITWPFFVPVFRFNGRWDLFGVCSVLFLENFFFKFEDDFGYLDTWAKNRSNLRPMQGQFDANLRPIRVQRASSLLDLRIVWVPCAVSDSRLGQLPSTNCTELMWIETQGQAGCLRDI